MQLFCSNIVDEYIDKGKRNFFRDVRRYSMCRIKFQIRFEITDYSILILLSKLSPEWAIFVLGFYRNKN